MTGTSRDHGSRRGPDNASTSARTRATDRVSRRAPGPLELALLGLRLNARPIAWGAGVLTIVLALGTLGILQSVDGGDPTRRTGMVVDVPSSQSTHVRVQLEGGDDVLVQRRQHATLAEGDRVTVLETVSALSTVGYRLVEVSAR